MIAAILLLVVIIGFFGILSILGFIDFDKSEFDFSEVNGGRCIEHFKQDHIVWKHFLECNDTGCSTLEFVNYFPSFGVCSVSHSGNKTHFEFVESCTEVVRCIYVTNNHNVTVPYELAVSRGFKG